ncbi:MAG: CoA transferase, partial [Rhodospirillales bacterium]|nr:CoA transferase [Rhodospirillales bacterium]
TGEGPGRPPVKVGVPMTDISAGTLAALGITGAIHRRSVTGRGQLVDTSLFEAGIMYTFLQSAIHLASGQVPGAMGSGHPVMAPYQAFQSSDGWLIVGAGNQSNWLKLTVCLEAPELADDPRFADSPRRIDHLDELVEILGGYFARYGNEELLARLEAAGVPAGPVYDIAQMNADPQALARGMIQEVGSASGAPMKAIGHPVKYSEAPASILRRAPLLGEHTHQVLAEFGFEAGEINALAQAGDISDRGRQG